MVSVIYQKRAHPLLWGVVSGCKGHFPAASYVEVLTQLQQLLPATASVVVLGDGAFDSVALQTFLAQAGWDYVCRTVKNTQVCLDGTWLSLAEIAIWPGKRLLLEQVRFTAQAYGPIQIVIGWRHGYQEPIYLITNLELAAEACYWYRRRMRSETFSSDQKSRGFHLHKSHLADPQRLARVLIAACLAYLWMIYLGTLCRQPGGHKVSHRTDRCDLSLFQLGLDLLDYFENEGKRIPVDFKPYRSPSLHESVRY